MADLTEPAGPARILSAEGRLGRVIVARILPGNDLITAIEEICRRHQVRQGLITETIGCLINPRFRHVSTTELQGDRGLSSYKTIEGPGSLVVGQGLIAASEDGSRLDIHLHCTITDAAGVVYGGHFLKGGSTVLTTTDVTVVDVEGLRLVRRADPDSGLVFTHVLPA